MFSCSDSCNILFVHPKKENLNPTIQDQLSQCDSLSQFQIWPSQTVTVDSKYFDSISGQPLLSHNYFCATNVQSYFLSIHTLLIGQSHFTLDRIGGADANMSYDVIFNSVFYIEWNVHSQRRILCLVVKYNLDRDWTNYPQVCPLLKFAISW